MCSDGSMDYEDFKELLIQELKRRLDARVTVLIQKMLKNNGIYEDAVFLSVPDLKVSPSFYADQLYGQYVKTGNLTKIVEEILLVFQCNLDDRQPNIEFFKQFNMVKERLLFKLIHYEENRTLLKQTPHRRYLDLAIVYYCLFGDEQIKNGAINIQNSHLQMWGATEEQLYQAALLNTPVALTAQLIKMSDLVSQPFELWEDYIQSQQENEIMMEPTGQRLEHYMYILTNNRRLLGAAAILYPSLLSRVAKTLDSDLYVLPSSIHEVILIPVEACDVGREELEQMVKEVNDGHVEDDEILSYQVYRYDKQNDCLE